MAKMQVEDLQDGPLYLVTRLLLLLFALRRPRKSKMLLLEQLVVDSQYVKWHVKESCGGGGRPCLRSEPVVELCLRGDDVARPDRRSFPSNRSLYFFYSTAGG